MMKLKYSFVCDYANVSMQGNLNASSIFTNISASAFPATLSRFFFVASIAFHRSEVGKHKFRLSFVDQDGKDVINPIAGELEATPQSLNANIIIELNAIKLSNPGTYQFDLTVDNNHIGSESFTASLRVPQPKHPS
jgi:hypothetical protein